MARNINLLEAGWETLVTGQNESITDVAKHKRDGTDIGL